jgi:hypothetical protein
MSAFTNGMLRYCNLSGSDKSGMLKQLIVITEAIFISGIIIPSFTVLYNKVFISPQLFHSDASSLKLNCRAEKKGTYFTVYDSHR